MAIFGPKPWVNPFRKMSIFRLFKVLVFIAQKFLFLCQNIVKDIFLAYIASNENVEKWPFLDKNYGLTPLEKCQLFDFLNFLFLKPRKGFLSKNGHFVNFFFLAIQARKMSFTIFQKEKTPFQAIKTSISKSRKTDIFFKRVNQ